jgi:hypothetical protein
MYSLGRRRPNADDSQCVQVSSVCIQRHLTDVFLEIDMDGCAVAMSTTITIRGRSIQTSPLDDNETQTTWRIRRRARDVGLANNGQMSGAPTLRPSGACPTALVEFR